MKNTTIKILGIVLTLAMLSGLLLAALPVSVAAADLSWSNFNLPQVTVGTSANVFAFSGDGKTMYLDSPVATTVQAASTGTTVTVLSTQNFAAAGLLSINGATPVAYTAKTSTAITLAVAATVAVNDVITSSALFKSTDAGFTWNSSGLDTTSGGVITGIAISGIAINPSNINDIAAIGVDATTGLSHVYRSINAGNTFYAFDPFTVVAGTTFTSVDVANNSNGLVSILVSFKSATNGGVALFDSSVGTWRYVGGTGSADLGTTSWGAATNGLAAKFSTNYGNDAAIVAVGAGTSVLVRGMIVATGSTWNTGGGIMDATLKYAGVAIPPTAGMFASMAIPSDYVPTSTVQNRVYVSIGDTAGQTTSTDVYRINGATSGTSTAYTLSTNINPSSVAYVGTASNGQIAVGSYTGVASFPTGAVVMSTNQVTSNTPTWNSSANSPAGSATANTSLKFTPSSTATAYTLFAGTAGTNSELATSSDLNSFWGIAFFRVSSYANTQLGSGYNRGQKDVWQIVRDGSSTAPANVMLFYSADSGNTWKCILNNGNNASISLTRSPAFTTDKTMFVTQSNKTGQHQARQIIKSSDAGLTWNLLNTPSNVDLINIGVVDANSYWVSSIDRVQLSTSSTYATLEGRTPANGPLGFSATFFVIPTTTGEYYVSTDNGVTFNRLGNSGQFGANVSPVGTVDVANKTIYAIADAATAGGDHSILKWTYGTDSSWQPYVNASFLPADLVGNVVATSANVTGIDNHPISSISKSSDGFWYIISNENVTAGVSGPQVWYTSDPVNIAFAAFAQTKISDIGGIETVPTSAGNSLDANKNIQFYLSIQQGNIVNGIFTAVTSTANGQTGTAASPNYYSYKVINYTNSLANGPKLTSPDGKAPAGTPSTSSSGTFDLVTFSWSSVTATNPKYQIQVAYDKAFQSIASTANGATFTSYNAVGTSSTTSQLDLNYLPSASVAAVPLLPAQTFYWRVRVVSPIVSKWTDAIMFNTAVVVTSGGGGLDTQGRIGPVNGATAVSVTPAITWGNVSGATGYDFKIATDPTFTSVVDSFTNKNTTVYAPSAALKANTTYYWEVRALNGTTASDWVISAFTTQAVAAPTGAASPAPTGTGPSTQPGGTTVVTVAPQPTPVITVVVPNTPAPAPTTPAYIWVIIVIGAVLVIAVIVLIARTRRV